MRHFFTLLALSLFTACSSAPKNPSPDWIRKPTRTADGGYIIFVGSGEDATSERSTFKAESQALQDLVNECSFAPKGTRIEDHFQEMSGHLFLTYARVAISFLDCDAAKAATDPASIQKIASAPLASQLKKYQDLLFAPSDAENPENPMLASTTIVEPSSPEEFFAFRQRVAYLKQRIILAPETVYVPNAPQTLSLTHQLSSSSEALRTYEQKNPNVKVWHRTWSQVDRKSKGPVREERSISNQTIKKKRRPQRRPLR